jgi:hypothetical protein
MLFDDAIATCSPSGFRVTALFSPVKPYANALADYQFTRHLPFAGVKLAPTYSCFYRLTNQGYSINPD